MIGSIEDQKQKFLPSLGGSLGHLFVVEGERDADFPIARIYYIVGVPSEATRGFHAHRTLRQLAICVSGKCSILLDDGKRRQTISLDQPAKTLEIGPMIWHEMSDFSEDAVLLVLADQVYDEADYIRDYKEFCELA